MRVLIADDEPLALEQLRGWLSLEQEVELIGAVSNGRDLLDAAERQRPDLIFTDIRMPVRDGLSAARELCRTSTAQIVFVTAYSEHAAEAFDLDAADYLLKPVRQDRVQEALKRASRRLSQPNATAPQAENGVEGLWIPGAKGAHRLAVSDIRWIEAAKDYVLLHTATRTHILRITMSQLERMLDPAALPRVHRSAFVRLSAIRSFERKGRRIARLTMDDGAIVEVGASYSARLAIALLEA